MNAPVRTFEVKQAIRDHVPVLAGLFGPSGSGKTFTALRLATGIQSVTGGDIYGIDTESRRMLHYADQFKFKHIDFRQPFGSLDYFEAMQFAVKQGAKIIVVDSMSHEHEGPGGYLMTHAAELDRIAGTDKEKRDKNNFTAWIKPARERRALINGMLQLNANFIFCFRAKEKLKIVGGGKPVEQGWMPIAGEEFVYEMTVCCLLYPNSRGVPTWNSSLPGERQMMKLPGQFEALFERPRQIDESFGKAIAQWAAGANSPEAPPRTMTVTDTGPTIATIIAAGEEAARGGKDSFTKWWNSRETKAARKMHNGQLTGHMPAFQKIAQEADAAPEPTDEDPFGLPPLEKTKGEATKVEQPKVDPIDWPKYIEHAGADIAKIASTGELATFQTGTIDYMKENGASEDDVSAFNKIVLERHAALA